MRRLAAMTAMTVFCGVIALAGCRSGTGVRREGAGPTGAAKSLPSIGPAIANDPVALATMVKKDTKVSADVRADLAPCSGADKYPVDTESGDLTRGDSPDLIVNVATCGDSLGVASYVYRLVDGRYQNVFADEKSPVFGSFDNGKLEIIREVYKGDDPVCCPTGQETLTYVWRGNRFVQLARTYTDYTTTTSPTAPAPADSAPAPAPTAARPVSPAPSYSTNGKSGN